MGSTMWGYYNYGDEKTFLCNFRMTKDQLEGGHRMLAEGGHLHDSQSKHVEYRFPGRFKFAVCMYVLAHGGGAGPYFKAAADCASLGESTVERWMGQFCRAILAIIAPTFLLFQPPSSNYIDLFICLQCTRREPLVACLIIQPCKHASISKISPRLELPGWETPLRT